MTCLRKDKLEWHPDEDLLMSKLHHVEEETSADSIQSYFRQLASILNLHCCCMTSAVGDPDMLKMRSRPSIDAATAPDHGDGKNNFTTLEPLQVAWLERCQNLSKLHRPTYNQTPCNSPRTMSRKQNDKTEERLLASPPSRRRLDRVSRRQTCNLVPTDSIRSLELNNLGGATVQRVKHVQML